MLQETDQQFVSRLNEALETSQTLREAVNKIGENYDAAYMRIRRLGYRIDRQLRLVPIHARALDGDQQPVA